MKTEKTIELPVHTLKKVEYIKVYHVMVRYKGQMQASTHLSYVNEETAEEAAASQRSFSDVEECFVVDDVIFIS